MYTAVNDLIVTFNIVTNIEISTLHNNTSTRLVLYVFVHPESLSLLVEDILFVNFMLCYIFG